MTRAEFFSLIDEIVEEAPGTFGADTELSAIEGWDSLSVVQFIAAMDSKLDAQIVPEALAQAKTGNDLLALVAEKVEG